MARLWAAVQGTTGGAVGAAGMRACGGAGNVEIVILKYIHTGRHK